MSNKISNAVNINDIGGKYKNISKHLIEKSVIEKYNIIKAMDHYNLFKKFNLVAYSIVVNNERLYYVTNKNRFRKLVEDKKIISAGGHYSYLGKFQYDSNTNKIVIIESCYGFNIKDIPNIEMIVCEKKDRSHINTLTLIMGPSKYYLNNNEYVEHNGENIWFSDDTGISTGKDIENDFEIIILDSKIDDDSILDYLKPIYYDDWDDYYLCIWDDIRLMKRQIHTKQNGVISIGILHTLSDYLPDIKSDNIRRITLKIDEKGKTGELFIKTRTNEYHYKVG